MKYLLATIFFILSTGPHAEECGNKVKLIIGEKKPTRQIEEWRGRLYEERINLGKLEREAREITEKLSKSPLRGKKFPLDSPPPQNWSENYPEINWLFLNSIEERSDHIHFQNILDNSAAIELAGVIIGKERLLRMSSIDALEFWDYVYGAMAFLKREQALQTLRVLNQLGKTQGEITSLRNRVYSVVPNFISRIFGRFPRNRSTVSAKKLLDGFANGNLRATIKKVRIYRSAENWFNLYRPINKEEEDYLVENFGNFIERLDPVSPRNLIRLLKTMDYRFSLPWTPSHYLGN